MKKKLKKSDFKLKTVGNNGETVACNYLKKHKYKILCKNYKTITGEIDIICESADYIVFVEVKTRNIDALASGVFAVNRTKQLHIIKTASQFMSKYNVKKQPRFDIIEVKYNTEDKMYEVVNHYIDAFMQGGSYATF